MYKWKIRGINVYPRHAVSRWCVFSSELILRVIVGSIGEGRKRPANVLSDAGLVTETVYHGLEDVFEDVGVEDGFWDDVADSTDEPGSCISHSSGRISHCFDDDWEGVKLVSEFD